MPLTTVMARQLDRQIRDIKAGRGKGSVADLHAWYRQFGQQLKDIELREVRSVLGIELSLNEMPFRELVPAGWLHDVLALYREAESPASFFFLSALSVLSQGIGRKVMIDRGNHTLGLDVSTLLISPAGTGRRSTACDSVVYGLADPAGVNIIADSFTYEAMGDALVESAGLKKIPPSGRIPSAHALIYAGEMSTLLGKGSYGDSIIPKLTDIIGKTSRFEWRTVKRGKLIFTSPMVNACFTSSPDWLIENLPPIVFGGGMLSRFLMSVEDGSEQTVTWAKPIDVNAKASCIARLAQVCSTAGTFNAPTGTAFNWYDKWYQNNQLRIKNGEYPDERMVPYLARKHDHLLRLAALLAIANGDALAFTELRFQQALQIIDWLEGGIPQAYSKMAQSPMVAAQKAMCRALERNNGMMEHSKLQRRMYRFTPLSSQFQMVVQSLIDMKCIRAAKTLTGRGTTYTLLKELE